MQMVQRENSRAPTYGYCRLISPLACILALACQAGGDAPGNNGGSSGNAGAPAVHLPEGGEFGVTLYGQATNCEQAQASGAPMRRITQAEFNHAANDLFGQNGSFASGIPDAKSDWLSTNTSSLISPTGVANYLGAAEKIADAAVTAIATLSTCSAASDSACISTFLSGVASRAFRGAGSAESIDPIIALYTAGQFSAEDNLKLAITAILTSPYFLYVVEYGQGTAGVVPLSGKEIAGRLAAALWRSVPDAALMAAAEAGELDSAEGVRAQAEKMLADPRANQAIDEFTTQFLELGGLEGATKDVTLFPDYLTQVKPFLLGETLRYSRDQFQNGDLNSLLNGTESFLNTELAAFYGATAPTAADAEGYGKTALPANRAGIMNLGAVLAAHGHPTKGSPVKRGLILRENFLCDPVAPPPANVNTNIQADGDEALDQFAAHAEQPGCSNCHQYIDPLGVSLNHFDTTGAITAKTPVGGNIHPPALASSPDISGAYADFPALGKQIAESDFGSKCFSLQSLRFVLGRGEFAGDACGYQQAADAFIASNNNLKEALLAAVSSDAFRNRRAVTAGAACQ